MTAREKLLGSNPRKSVIVKDPDSDAEFRVVKPSIAQLTILGEASKKSTADLAVAMCLHCIVDPDTNGPMFSRADEARIREMPLDGWLAEAIAALGKLQTDVPAEAEGKGA